MMKTIIISAVLAIGGLPACAANTYNKVLTDGTADKVLMGSGVGLTGVTIAASSSAVDGQSAASTDYVYIATVTVTLRGGRTAWIFYGADYEQTLAAARTYTLSLVINGVEKDSHSTTSSGSGAWAQVYDLDPVTSTAGVNVIAIRTKSSSATGAQLFYNAQIDVVEF